MDSSFKRFASPVSIMQSFLSRGLWRDTAGEKGLLLYLAAAWQGQHVAVGIPVMTPVMSQKGWSFCNLMALAWSSVTFPQLFQHRHHALSASGTPLHLFVTYSPPNDMALVMRTLYAPHLLLY